MSGKALGYLVLSALTLMFLLYTVGYLEGRLDERKNPTVHIQPFPYPRIEQAK